MSDTDNPFYRVFHSSPAAMAITRLRDGVFVDINPSFLSILGYRREDVVGKSSLEVGIISAEDREAAKALVEVEHGYRNREIPLRTRAGTIRHTKVSVEEIAWGGERCLVATCLDVTEARLAEALDAGQSEVLEMIATDAPLEDTLARLARVIEAQSEGMLCTILLLDEDLLHVRHGAAPSLPAAYVKAIDGAPIGPKAGSCGTAMYRGEPVIVRDILVDPLWEDYRAVAAPHGLRACWSTPIRSRRGRVLGSFAMYYREPRLPTAAEQRLIDRATHMAGIAVDRKQTDEALRQAQKMEAIGRLAGGIAHDFNNILMVINGASAVALQDVRETHPLYPHLIKISRSGEKAATLTRQLLAYSRKQILTPRVCSLNEIVSEMAAVVGPLIGEVRLVTLLDPALHPILADRGQIEQVLLNLIVNARDAMPTGGRLTVETANVMLEGAQLGGTPGTGAGPHVRLTVSDTGIGMSKETLGRLFEPFFTTKPPGEGTGLGLSMVYGIVKQSGGNITAQSEPGQGAVFRLLFPAALAPVAAEAPA